MTTRVGSNHMIVLWFDLKNDSVTKIEAGDHSLNSYNSAIKGKIRRNSK